MSGTKARLIWIKEMVTGQDVSKLLVNNMFKDRGKDRFVETSSSGGVCVPTSKHCIGGFARLTTAVREGFKRDPQSLILNAGDSFDGTIWYDLLRWNVTQEFMNCIPHDAHVLGNHEFTDGLDGVIPYLKHLDAPVVTANIIADKEPRIQGLYQPSIVVKRGGRRIGIIGVISAITKKLAPTGNLLFTNEVGTVRREAQKLHDDGVNIIIVLSHCGLGIDKQIALHGGPHIDIIVGGHSHSFLYNDMLSEQFYRPVGPYPVVVKQKGRKSSTLVPIVQVGNMTQYLGEIKLFFDDKGNLLRWNGSPHYLGNKVKQAPDVLKRVAKYLRIIKEKTRQKASKPSQDTKRNCKKQTFHPQQCVKKQMMIGISKPRSMKSYTNKKRKDTKNSNGIINITVL